jgi:hypothetical protein
VRGIDRRQRGEEKRKQFFFEKKNQKTFDFFEAAGADGYLTETLNFLRFLLGGVRLDTVFFVTTKNCFS